MYTAIIEELLSHDSSSTWLSMDWKVWFNSINIIKFKQHRIYIHSFHWHVQNATIPCRSQELLPFLSVMYFFLPPFSANYSSILSHFILPSISWSTSQSCCSQIIYNTLLVILFSSILCLCPNQCSLFNLIASVQNIYEIYISKFTVLLKCTQLYEWSCAGQMEGLRVFLLPSSPGQLWSPQPPNKLVLDGIVSPCRKAEKVEHDHSPPKSKEVKEHSFTVGYLHDRVFK